MEEFTSMDLYSIHISCVDLIKGDPFPFDGVEEVKIVTKSRFDSLLRTFHNIDDLDVKIESFKKVPTEHIKDSIRYKVEISQEKQWDKKSQYVETILNAKKSQAIGDQIDQRISEQTKNTGK